MRQEEALLVSLLNSIKTTTSFQKPQLETLFPTNKLADVALLWADVEPKSLDEVSSRVERAKEDLNHTTFKDKKITVTDLPVDSLLFVGNIAPEVEREELRRLFAPYGSIMRAWVCFSSLLVVW